MIILGVSYTGAHDSSAAILVDGELVAAAEEEERGEVWGCVRWAWCSDAVQVLHRIRHAKSPSIKPIS